MSESNYLTLFDVTINPLTFNPPKQLPEGATDDEIKKYSEARKSLEKDIYSNAYNADQNLAEIVALGIDGFENAEHKKLWQADQEQFKADKKKATIDSKGIRIKDKDDKPTKYPIENWYKKATSEQKKRNKLRLENKLNDNDRKVALQEYQAASYNVIKNSAGIESTAYEMGIIAIVQRGASFNFMFDNFKQLVKTDDVRVCRKDKGGNVLTKKTKRKDKNGKLISVPVKHKNFKEYIDAQDDVSLSYPMISRYRLVADYAGEVSQVIHEVHQINQGTSNLAVESTPNISGVELQKTISTSKGEITNGIELTIYSDEAYDQLEKSEKDDKRNINCADVSMSVTSMWKLATVIKKLLFPTAKDSDDEKETIAKQSFLSSPNGKTKHASRILFNKPFSERELNTAFKSLNSEYKKATKIATNAFDAYTDAKATAGSAKGDIGTTLSALKKLGKVEDKTIDEKNDGLTAEVRQRLKRCLGIKK